MANCYEWAHQVKWAIVTSGPIIIFNKMLPMFSYRPIIFQQLLLMPLDGLIAVATAVADGFIWAHYFFGGFSHCPCMGPLQLQQLLLMVLYGPITVLAAHANALI